MTPPPVFPARVDILTKETSFNFYGGLMVALQFFKRTPTSHPIKIIFDMDLKRELINIVNSSADNLSAILTERYDPSENPNRGTNILMAEILEAEKVEGVA